MRFLKPEIFYPEYFEDSSEKTHESNYDQFDFKNEEYDMYFNSIKNQLPKQLVEIFSEEYNGYLNNRFHDCTIKELSLIGSSQYYKQAYDSIYLVIELGEIEYRIEFFKIKKLNILNQNNHNIKMLLGEILLCELGIEGSFYTFEFFTSTAMQLYVEFNKVKITKKIKL
jgi:hypothetical protein